MTSLHLRLGRALKPKWLAPLALVGLALLLQLGGEPVRLALRYERGAVLDGQLWRLLTAHLVHLGWIHCLLNLAALGLCVLLSRGRLPGRFWWCATGALGAGIGILMLLGAPEVADYVGLSGVVYGLFVCVLAPPAWRGDRGALIVLALVLGRIAWQMLAEAPDARVELIGGIVITKAHAYGAGLGLAWVLCQEVLDRRRRVGG